MTAVFTEKEQKESFAIKRKLFTMWLISLIVYVTLIAAMVVINVVFISLYRSRAVYKPFQYASIALSIIFSCGSVFFFSIKYRLTSKYCRMLRDMKVGTKEKNHGKFLRIDPDVTTKDGVFFYGIYLDCPPIKRGDITERKILVERTHSLPKFNPGDEIKFITYANILVAYEWIPRQNEAQENQIQEQENTQVKDEEI